MLSNSQAESVCAHVLFFINSCKKQENQTQMKTILPAPDKVALFWREHFAIMPQV